MTVSGNTGYGIAAALGSTVHIDGATIQNNGACSVYCASQLYIAGASALLATGETTVQSSSSLTPQPPLIEIVGASSARIDKSTVQNSAGAVSGAILIASASSLQTNLTTFLATGTSRPVIEATGSSSVVLAGGNTITASGTGGTAIQIDHSSSLLHEPAISLGYTSNGTETISGAGSVQVQSSMDLGQGNISSSPGVTWTLSGSEIVNVQQNSSFRLSGGVSIPGGNGVKIQQGSNGFFNVNNGGTNTATIACTNSANNPMAHVSNPGSVSSVTTYNLNDVLAGDSVATHAGQTNACLNF